MRLPRAAPPHSRLASPHARVRVATAAAAATAAVVVIVVVVVVVVVVVEVAIVVVVVDRSIARSIARSLDRSTAWFSPPTHPCSRVHPRSTALALAVAEVRARWFVGGGIGNVGSLPVSR